VYQAFPRKDLYKIESALPIVRINLSSVVNFWLRSYSRVKAWSAAGNFVFLLGFNLLYITVKDMGFGLLPDNFFCCVT
jgi:hypothetical protein